MPFTLSLEREETSPQGKSEGVGVGQCIMYSVECIMKGKVKSKSAAQAQITQEAEYEPPVSCKSKPEVDC